MAIAVCALGLLLALAPSLLPTGAAVDHAVAPMLRLVGALIALFALLALRLPILRWANVVLAAAVLATTPLVAGDAPIRLLVVALASLVVVTSTFAGSTEPLRIRGNSTRAA